MLTPEYLNSCTDYLLGMYDQLQTEICCDIARKLVKTGRLTDSAWMQAKRVQQSGKLMEDVISYVASIANLSEAEVQRMFNEAGLKNIEYDSAPLRNAGIDVDLKLSPAMQQVLKANIQKTNGDIRNLTMTTSVAAQTQYMDAVNMAHMKVASGGFSYSRAIADAIRSAAVQGNSVLYRTGARSKLDVAVRRAVLTSVNQTAGKITEQYASDMGAEYYETSAHSGARPSHAVWQGRVFKINGSAPGYPNFAEATGYGTGEGLCGWNCRHSFYPYWPGISKRAYTSEKLAWMNAERFEFDGEKLTDYQCSQIQREYERGIRATKRILACYDAAVQSLTDDAAIAELKERFAGESVNLKEQERKLRGFCKQTNRSYDSVRTQVYAYKDSAGRIVNFGRSTSSKAVWANRKTKGV